MTTASTQSGIGRDSLEELFSGASNFVERMPMLRLALERTGPLCAEHLGRTSPTPLQLALQSLQSGVAAELLGEHAGASLAAVVHAPKWGTRLVVSARREAVLAVVEMLLGGDGSQPAAALDRPLSRIEAKIAGLLFEHIAEALAASFAPVAETPFFVEATSDAIDFEVIGRRNSAVVVAKYRLDAGERGGEVLIAIPRSALVPMRRALSHVPVKDAAAPDPRWTQQMQNELDRAGIVLSAVLDERMGLLGEVSNFQVGQVIELNATAHSRVRLECNGERLFWCHLGKSVGKYTLRVDEAVDREQEFMDEILSA